MIWEVLQLVAGLIALVVLFKWLEKDDVDLLD
mgnify:CR=1 FL=1